MALGCLGICIAVVLLRKCASGSYGLATANIAEAETSTGRLAHRLVAPPKISCFVCYADECSLPADRLRRCNGTSCRHTTWFAMAGHHAVLNVDYGCSIQAYSFSGPFYCTAEGGIKYYRYDCFCGNNSCNDPTGQPTAEPETTTYTPSVSTTLHPSTTTRKTQPHPGVLEAWQVVLVVLVVVIAVGGLTALGYKYRLNIRQYYSRYRY